MSTSSAQFVSFFLFFFAQHVWTNQLPDNDIAVWCFWGCMLTDVTTEDKWNFANKSSTWLSDWSLDSRYIHLCTRLMIWIILNWIIHGHSFFLLMSCLFNFVTLMSRDSLAAKIYHKHTVGMVRWFHRQWVAARLASLIFKKTKKHADGTSKKPADKPQGYRRGLRSSWLQLYWYVTWTISDPTFYHVCTFPPREQSVLIFWW